MKPKKDKNAIDAYRARRAARLEGKQTVSAAFSQSLDDYFMTRKEQEALLKPGAYDADAIIRQQHEKHDAERWGKISSTEARKNMIRRQSYIDPETGYPWGKL